MAVVLGVVHVVGMTDSSEEPLFADLNGGGANDLLLRWTDSFGSSLDTEVYS